MVTLGGMSLLLADVADGASGIPVPAVVVLAGLAAVLVMVERRHPEPVMPGRCWHDVRCRWRTWC